MRRLSRAIPSRRSQLVYQLALRPEAGVNSILRMLVAFEGANDDYQLLDVKQADFAFLPFDGPVEPIVRPLAPVWDRKTKAFK